jgi:hypothetical protein
MKPHEKAKYEKERAAAALSSPAPCFNMQNKGTCKYGDGCRFSHSSSSKQVRSISDKQRGGKGSQATHSSPEKGNEKREGELEKRICFSFQKTGECKKPGCVYAHVVFCNTCRLTNHFQDACPKGTAHREAFGDDNTVDSDEDVIVMMANATGQDTMPGTSSGFEEEEDMHAFVISQSEGASAVAQGGAGTSGDNIAFPVIVIHP